MPAPNYMSAAPQNLGDIISMIGATLKDASPGSNSDAIAQTRNYIQQRNMARYQMGMMGQLQSALRGTPAQFTTGPDPSVSAPTPVSGNASDGPSPSVPPGAPPADVGDLSGAMANLAQQAAPAPSAAPPPGAAASYAYQAPQLVPGSGKAASLRDPGIQQSIMALSSMGIPMRDVVSMLNDSQPDMAVGSDGTVYDKKNPNMAGHVFANRTAVNNQILDLNDAKNTNLSIPSAPVPGALAVYDNLGHIVDWKMPQGSIGAISAVEDAKATAQERAKAGLDLVYPKLAEGGEASPTSRLALLGGPPSGAPLLNDSQAPGAPSASAGPTANPAAGAPKLGSPSLAAVELAKARAANQGKNESDIAGARSAMQQVDDQTNMIAQNLHDMVGETQHIDPKDPNKSIWAKTKPGMIGHLSTGSGVNMIEVVPFLNQQAKDLEAKIETVRNGTSFNSLQAIKGAMAAAGDGGAAGIRMTDQTSRMLGEINGSLNQDQSGPQFEATVRRHIAQLETLSRDRHALFDSQYQGIRQNTPGQTGPTANYSPATQPRTPKLQAPNYTITAIRKAGAQ